MARKPKRIFSEENLQKIESDISALARRFITPIDNIRSLKRRSDSEVKGESQVNTSSFTESRCHAFYRMLGLPVVNANGNSFYNTGFKLPVEDKIKTINESFKGSPAGNLSSLREQRASEIDTFYRGRSFNAAIYTYLFCKSPFVQFASFDTSLGPLDFDKQDFEDVKRKEYLEEFFEINPQTKVSNYKPEQVTLLAANLNQNVVSGNHLLRPLVVDPFIADNVEPAELRVCIPFLSTKQLTKISNSPDKFCLRPGIEFILRERLQSVSENPFFYRNAIAIIQNDSREAPVNSEDINLFKDTIRALSEGNDLENQDKFFLENITSLEFRYLASLIKLLKVVIKKLVEAQQDVEKSIDKISWVPQPAANGPQFGPKQGCTLWTQNLTRTNEIARRILNLKLNLNLAEATVNDYNDLGDFAIPGLKSSFANGESVKKITKDLKKEERDQQKFAIRGHNAMANIELITGETSGLGLVDIFCIYFALWSVDIRFLIGLLDDSSLQRLISNNPLLVNNEVEAQKQGSRPSVRECLSEIEKSLSLALSFTETLYKREGIKYQPVATVNS